MVAEVIILVFAGGVALFAWVIIQDVRQQRRRRRILAEQCERCGYDLRATQNCCPECGFTFVRRRRRRARQSGTRKPDGSTAGGSGLRKPLPGETLVPIHVAKDAAEANYFELQLSAREWCFVLSPPLARRSRLPDPPDGYTLNVWSGDVEAIEPLMSRLRENWQKRRAL